MTPAKKPHTADVVRHIADGRIVIQRYDPKWPEQKTAGGLVMPETVVAGRAVTNGKGEIIKADKQVVFGVVIACGKLINRQNTEPFPEDKQREFPLPTGSLVKITQTAIDYQICPGQDSFNTYDTQEWLLPGEMLEPSIWGENTP